MLRPSPPRLLLLLPTVTYRTVAFVEAARRLGADLTVASERPSTFERANPTGLVTLDFADPTHAAAQAREFARAHPVHGVVAVDDDTAVVAAAIAEALGLRGNPVAAAAAARDKHQQRQLLATAGVAVPRFERLTIAADPEQVASGVSYPCVLKPLRLSASRGVIRADTPEAFVAAFERLKRILENAGCARSILVEDFVPGSEVAVEGLVTQGALQVLAIFDKPDPLDGPFFEETIYVTPSRLARTAQQEVAACARAAVDALGLRDGPIHAEVRHNDRGAWLIELAARPIGGRCSGALRFESRDAGGGMRDVSLEEIVIRHALGMELPALEREQQASGVMMIPVPGAGVVRDVRGVGDAQAVPLVEEVVITTHPGQTLVPWPEGSRYPGFIFARGKTSEAVEAALRAAHDRLEFVMEPAD
jgi:formate-dependent phosphoribosylglycinamide formyltransferase (GAR transformylase)